jgi:hypothetical protein
MVEFQRRHGGGFISIFTYKVWKVTKGSLVIAKGEKVGTLYLCNGNVDSSISLASIGVDIACGIIGLDTQVRRGCKYFTKEICCQILNKLIWISVSILFMENRREFVLSESE